MALTLDEAVQRLAALARAGPLGGAHVVGGAVRDALLGRPVHEVDIAVPGTLEAAAPVVQRALGVYGALVGGEHPVLHLGVQDGAVDLVPMHGDLAADLDRRDFTINALALPLEALADAGLSAIRPASVVDRHDGLDDLSAGRVRLVSPAALEADPLRALRAVRIACELDFRIAPETARLLPAAREALPGIAADRVGAELQRIFASARAARGLRLLEAAGLLFACFPELEEGRDVDQRPHHLYTVLEHALVAAEWMDVFLLPEPPADPQRSAAWRGVWEAEWPRTRWGDVRAHLERHAMPLRIATLLHDAGKPRTLTVEPDGNTRFFGHAEAGAEIARAALRRWRFPNAVAERVSLLIEQHLRPGQATSPGEPPTPRALHRFHRALGDATPDVCLLFLADSMATAGPDALLPRWHAYVAHVRRIVTWAPPVPVDGARLVTGHDVIAATGLEPGPEVGRVLLAVEEALAAGEVTTKDEALALAREIASGSASG